MTEVKREVVERKAYRWGLTREEFELRQAQIEKRRAETDEAQLFDLYARALFPFVLAPEPPDGHSDSAIPE